jgi:hypothetical protein
MPTQDIFIFQPSTPEESNALKAFAKALKIKFERSKKEIYSPEFVEKIMESKKQISEGKFIEVKPENIKSFIDNL